MLTWNVYTENANRVEIEIYNIFRHRGFLQDCREHFLAYEQKASAATEDLRILEREVSNTLQYFFWSKCEWEIILSDWPPSDRFKKLKVDVYDQVMLNWPVFFNYLFEHRYELLEETK